MHIFMLKYQYVGYLFISLFVYKYTCERLLVSMFKTNINIRVLMFDVWFDA